jgi:adenylate cyclase
MVKFLSQNSRWIIAGFGVLIFGLSQTSWLETSELWQTAEGKLIDRRYWARGERAPDPDLKLLGVENSSFKLDALAPEEIQASPTLQLMRHPEWDRRIHAAILKKLLKAGAKVVVFDFDFEGVTDGDHEFAKALQEYKDHVVIGESFSEENGSNGGRIQKLNTPNDALLLPGTESIVGLANFWPDPDGVFRHGKYHTSIEHEAGLGGFPDNLIHLTVLAVGKFKGRMVMPPDELPNYFDFSGREGIYEALPVENIFVEKLWEAPPFRGGTIFSNKIVVVGQMTEIQHDIHPTPFGNTPGPEIQAQVMAALLRESWLTDSSPLVKVTLALVMLGFALGICLCISNALLKVSLLAASVVLFFAGCQLAFTHCKLVFPMAPPLFCLLASGAFGVVFQFALEQFERLRYRLVLGRYVSENVARTVLEDKRSFEESLRGRKKPVTILFNDIRGFTSMAEAGDPEKLVAQLNEYFGEMVNIIEEQNHGTLQKFIGDAIMAAWGDVHSDGIEIDSIRAVTAALQMRPALAKLNARWKDDPDRQNLSIGIGVNHGEVIYGNIGTHKRMELTVLGDGVNLAARLESATKQFHTDILIGEQTEKLTREQFVFRTVDLLTVKGKQRPVEVYALVGDRSQPAPAWLEKYHAAIKLYRAREFAEAIARLEVVRQEIGHQDYLCDMYVERCKGYLAAPPPPDWDGSYKLLEK